MNINKATALIYDLSRGATKEYDNHFPSAKEIVEKIDTIFEEITGGYYPYGIVLAPEYGKGKAKDTVKWELAEKNMMDWQGIYRALMDIREGNVYELTKKKFTPRITTVGNRADLYLWHLLKKSRSYN